MPGPQWRVFLSNPEATRMPSPSESVAAYTDRAIAQAHERVATARRVASEATTRSDRLKAATAELIAASVRLMQRVGTR